MEIAYYGGEFIDINSKVIPIQERGHQFGDGIYEVIRVYNGKLFLVDEHLHRLEKSAEAIFLSLPLSLDELKSLMTEGLSKSQLKEAEVYIQITRGIAPRTHYFPEVPSQLSMTIKAARAIDPTKHKNGISVLLLEDERWKNCFIKSLNLLPNVLAKQKAISSGNDEAIFIKDGLITEGSSSNLFVVKDGILYTAPATNKILHGITRSAVLQLAAKRDIDIKEVEFDVEFLLQADEAFITSTSVEVQPIAKIDQHSLPTPWPITMHLQEDYKKLYIQS